MIGERDDRVVNGRHPRIEFLVESTREIADIGAADRNERAIHRQLLVAAIFHDLFESGRDGQHGLAGAGATIESDDAHVGVEQKFEGEPLLFRAGAEPPGFGGRRRDEAYVTVEASGQRRLAAGAEDGERVVDEGARSGDVVGRQRLAVVQAVDEIGGAVDGHVAERTR